MNPIEIYTDGSARGNPGPGGYGTVLMERGHRREFSGGFAKTTNNRMEILAAIIGLEALGGGSEGVTVYSDSKYVVDAIDKKWIAGWKRRGWARAGKQKLKNADLWRRIDPLLKRHRVTARWVKGHAGHVENERCDELATSAADAGGLPPDEGYLADLDGGQADLFG